MCRRRSDFTKLARCDGLARRVRCGIALFVLFAAGVGPVKTASADLLWLAGKEQPVSGMVIMENAESVRFRYMVGEVEKLVDVDRKEIVELVVTLDQQRLSSLSPQNITMYLDYAEELASFSEDRYAIQAARQMALVAARLSTGQQRSSAFRLLISLCEGQNKRNVQRLAYLYDQNIALQEPGKAKSEPIDPTASTTLIEIVRLIRRNRSEDAAALLKQDRIVKLLEPLLGSYANTCTLGELRVAANADELTVVQLSKILQLEHNLVSQAEPALEKAEAEGWFEASSQVVESNQMLPEFENVLELDPRLSIFRDGAWVAPSVDP